MGMNISNIIGDPLCLLLSIFQNPSRKLNSISVFIFCYYNPTRFCKNDKKMDFSRGISQNIGSMEVWPWLSPLISGSCHKKLGALLLFVTKNLSRLLVIRIHCKGPSHSTTAISIVFVGWVQ
eukprot:TRINITY_DN5588_c0_g2_i11.p1 TRINITY_DN5588_c0_g2~~TRINITY_DN5588_c0_g2_i11.p1  ORF type:complete len:122 (-),score=15.54 TRINITY_DN5588_c0_g2_i11:37-402(-)